MSESPTTADAQKPNIPPAMEIVQEVPDESFEIVFAEELPLHAPKAHAIKPRRPNTARPKRPAKKTRQAPPTHRSQ